nr:putative quinol monooxygenase [Pseudoprimorskyibacter insulae]
MTCPPESAPAVRAALPDHIRLTRAEPGCIRFDVTETAPGVFTVEELFTDQAAFDAHQSRTRASAWFAVTQDFPRDYSVVSE